MSVAFVGRDAELRVLTALVATVRRENVPAAALISGEPGNGKSRLLREALARADPRRTVTITGFEPTQPIALAAAGGLLRRLAGVPEQGPRLDALAFGGSAELTSQGLVAVFEAAHRAHAAFGPLVVAVDDLQWVDAQSLALLHYLVSASESSRLPLAVLATSRPSAAASSFSTGIGGPLPDGRRRSIELRGLPLEEGVALVRAIDGRLDREAAEALWRRADGSPFWLEALARARGSTVTADPIADRLSALTRDAAGLLHVLVVGGRPFAPEELVAILEWPPDRLDPALHELAGRGLAIQDHAAVRLSHDLVRESAARGVQAATAIAAHARLAAGLERLAADDVQLLAEALDHRTAAGLSTADLATRLARSPQRRLLGGEQLRRLSSIADALPAGSDERLGLDRALGQLAADLGDQALATRHWSRVASVADDATLRRRAEIEAARAAWEAGRSKDAHAHLDRARSLPDDPAAAIELDALEASVLLDLDKDVARGAAVAERAVVRGRELMAAAGAPDRLPVEARSGLLMAILAAAKAAWKEERAEDLVSLTEDALMIAEGLGDEARVNASLSGAWALLQLGRYPVSEQFARDAWETSARLLLPSPRSESGLLLARVLYGLGRLREAEAITRETDELQSRIHPWPLGELSKALRAVIELSLDAPGALQRFASVASGVDQHQKISLHEAVAVWVSRRDGPRGAAEVDRQLAAARAAADAVACPRCSGELRAVSVEVLARIARVQEAADVLARWEAGLEGQGHLARQLWQAQAHAAIAMATAREDAPVKLAALAEAYESAGWLQDAMWTRFDLGRVLAASGQRGPAIEAYTAAAAMAARAEAAGVERLAAQALRGLGVRAWRRGPASADRDGLAGLSAREREVARLAAGGATNPEVAAALVISPKTVERHLTNILAKLGLRNRTELAAVAGPGLVRESPDD